MQKQQQYQQVFNRFDSAGYSKINAEELRLCVSSIGGGWKMTVEEAEAAVAAMDMDGDGLVCLEELVGMIEGGDEEEERERDLKEAFKLYEEEGVGCITPKSLKIMLSKLGERRSLRHCAAIISRFDVNGDGLLNFQEFKLMMA